MNFEKPTKPDSIESALQNELDHDPETVLAAYETPFYTAFHNKREEDGIEEFGKFDFDSLGNSEILAKAMMQFVSLLDTASEGKRDPLELAKLSRDYLEACYAYSYFSSYPEKRTEEGAEKEKAAIARRAELKQEILTILRGSHTVH